MFTNIILRDMGYDSYYDDKNFEKVYETSYQPAIKIFNNFLEAKIIKESDIIKSIMNNNYQKIITQTGKYIEKVEGIDYITKLNFNRGVENKTFDFYKGLNKSFGYTVKENEEVMSKQDAYKSLYKLNNIAQEIKEEKNNKFALKDKFFEFVSDKIDSVKESYVDEALNEEHAPSFATEVITEKIMNTEELFPEMDTIPEVEFDITEKLLDCDEDEFNLEDRLIEDNEIQM